MDVVDREGSVVVIVDLAVPQGSAASSDPVTLISRAQRKLMSELGAGAQVVDRFRRRSPRLMLRVDARALTELRQSSLVVNISLAEAGEPTQ
ncbi:MAG TPA: hypothetical protein VHN37_11630 [Actinomycetota bacterium]|nr:hypothetical protein [Actinomycetota bacterium]